MHLCIWHFFLSEEILSHEVPLNLKELSSHDLFWETILAPTWAGFWGTLLDCHRPVCSTEDLVTGLHLHLCSCRTVGFSEAGTISCSSPPPRFTLQRGTGAVRCLSARDLYLAFRSTGKLPSHGAGGRPVFPEREGEAENVQMWKLRPYSRSPRQSWHTALAHPFP